MSNENAKSQKPQTVTIDGEQYVFDDLSDEIKNMIALWNAWNVDLQKSKSEVIKNETAMYKISMDITRAVKEPTSRSTANKSSTDIKLPRDANGNV